MEALSWCRTIAFPWRSAAAKAPALRWALHALFWTCVLAGLWYLNSVGGIERNLRSTSPGLHRLWLPLLGVLVYAVAWLSAALWDALGREIVTVAWPDIDDAWSDARQALARAEIDAVRTPLFLILGPLPGEMQGALATLGASMLPLRASAPLRVFAHVDGIFVVCDRLARLGQTDSPDTDPCQADRLRHLGELLLRERAPAAPLQGIVVIVPSNAPARRTLLACQDDLRAVRQATGLEVPLYLALSGVPPLPNADAAGSWVQRFPPLPDLDPAEIMAMYQDGIDNLCLAQLPLEAYAQMRPEPEALAENLRVYQWLNDVHGRRSRLEKLLVDGMQTDASEPGLVAGCYLVPDRSAEPRTVALVRRLCADMLTQRRTVTWTAETLLRVEEERRRARLGYAIGSVVLFLVIAATGALLMWRP